MRKLILRSGLPPGDIIMLTAAVRDLHRCYPGVYQTDVRTHFSELWENNPHLTHLSEDHSDVEEIECEYPLINRCNEVPYHCLHGFIEFLNERLRIAIRLSASKGDIHLSPREESWFSQIHELTGENTPFWIVGAGGKYDVTIKWWESARYQTVVDHFRGKIQFVQVGRLQHHHPRLDGVIDLRGMTTLRELIRLVYHSQGILCPITCLMHLAAAVPTKPKQPQLRPCVVVAGGREPAHWEAYPGHQFIHLNGSLPCCAKVACWKDRAIPLGDGQKQDRRDRLCLDVVDRIPRCMHLITPEEVIRRIELYYSGGILKSLSDQQFSAAQKGIAATANNDFDQMPLTLQSAGEACHQFIKHISEYSGEYEGRGIVICAGGVRYFTNAWVCINMLRRLGCDLPIQVWHLGIKELDNQMKEVIEPLGVSCVDACRERKRFPIRLLSGWALKPYAIVNSPFREVLLLDADNVPVVNPIFLFETPEFQRNGAIFWPDYTKKQGRKASTIWRSCGLRRPREPEFETGQIVVDKKRCWRALRLALWFNENSDFYYHHIHGDKETFHLAFRKLNQGYALVPKPIHTLTGTMCQHDFQGRRVFQHRNTDKWDLLLCNRRVKDFWFEKECRDYIVQLQQHWEGQSHCLKGGVRQFPTVLRKRTPPTIGAVLISCHERNELREKTLGNLANTDWGTLPVHVEMDRENGKHHRRRQTICAFSALKAAVTKPNDYILFLEDDLIFNRYIRHNLQHWAPLNNGVVSIAGLYNPGLRETACDVKNHCRVVAPTAIFGSQAFLISRKTAKYILNHWNEVRGMQDIKISRLAGRLGTPIVYHAPSLVQHVGIKSVYGGPFHHAADFDLTWRASTLK
jgi:ADP-heptose:LPS heptosyltransferase